ncbi:hypothetical protein [Streptomyces sp. V3I7]|nr:hypothetical protein [Streptomyces sp. V3I7]MDQ0988791.1 hypothetical protein [Streptomyces sp. V3I7]
MLGESDRRLRQRPRTLHGVQNKARLMRALYGRLDRPQNTVPSVKATVSP